MTIIKVLTRRVIAKNDFHKCKCLLNNLYREAYNNKYFLGASTYIESKDKNLPECTHDNIFTISKWESSFEWNKWLNSKYRVNEIKKHDNLITKETHTILRNVKQDIFLL